MLIKKWPLHPKPYKYEIISEWVHRIAKVYEISYPIFCKKVLNLTSDEILELCYFVPEMALQILSVGADVPIEDLRFRNIGDMHKKITPRLEEALASEEITFEGSKVVYNMPKSIYGHV
jgi:hypothetical protein